MRIESMFYWNVYILARRKVKECTHKTAINIILLTHKRSKKCDFKRCEIKELILKIMKQRQKIKRVNNLYFKNICALQ